jgi:cyclophilin family peptidyl-prolyl cis-trans isomerase
MTFALVLLAFALDPTTAPPTAPETKASAPEAPAATPTPAGVVVRLETTEGAIQLELDREKAPLTVENFLKYARAGHYDGTIFHRVIPRFMIQGGGMNVSMIEKPTKAPIRNEHSNGLRNDKGTISMARTGDPHSATSQFFINLVDNPRLDSGDGYAVFGKVVEGMDVVEKIGTVPTGSKGGHENVPRTPIILEKVRVVFDAKAPEAAKPAAPKPAAPKKDAKPPADAPKTDKK